MTEFGDKYISIHKNHVYVTFTLDRRYIYEMEKEIQ